MKEIVDAITERVRENLTDEMRAERKWTYDSIQDETRMRKIEDMTPDEAYRCGFQDGHHKGQREAMALFANNLSPEQYVSIVGG